MEPLVDTFKVRSLGPYHKYNISKSFLLRLRIKLFFCKEQFSRSLRLRSQAGLEKPGGALKEREHGFSDRSFQFFLICITLCSTTGGADEYDVPDAFHATHSQQTLNEKGILRSGSALIWKSEIPHHSWNYSSSAAVEKHQLERCCQLSCDWCLSAQLWLVWSVLVRIIQKDTRSQRVQLAVETKECCLDRLKWIWQIDQVVLNAQVGWFVQK